MNGLTRKTPTWIVLLFMLTFSTPAAIVGPVALADDATDRTRPTAGVDGKRAEPNHGADWPRLFGPTGDSVVVDPTVELNWPSDGPRRLWSMPLGESYTSPAIVGNRMIVFHRMGDEEIVDAVDLATRQRQWRFSYPTNYVDQYGYNNGPRSTPIVSGDHVYTFGAEGKLHCLRALTGEQVWRRDLNVEYKVDQEFFGVGASPLLEGGRLLVNIGGTRIEAGVVAIDAATGKTLWQATSDGASYATPTAATIGGNRVAIFFTKDGLCSIDPSVGKVKWSIPFRSRLYESVNASSPIVVGDLVFASASYGTGSLCVRVGKDGSHEELWRSERAMDSHFSNLMPLGDCVVGFSGRHEGDAELRCVKLATGEIQWSAPSLLGRGSMVRVGEEFILWGERGHLLVRKLSPTAAPDLPLDPSEVRPLLTYPCWTPPAIAGGRLFLRNETELVCYDLRKKAGK